MKGKLNKALKSNRYYSSIGKQLSDLREQLKAEGKYDTPLNFNEPDETDASSTYAADSIEFSCFDVSAIK
jgi:hypothetical protein